MTLLTTKFCSRCQTEKSAEEFYLRRGGKDFSSYCRECTTDQTVERQRRLKRLSLDYLGGKCLICGYSHCQEALDFHHLNPEEKEFSLAALHTTSFSEKIMKELDKCVILCATCHREVHAGITELPSNLIVNSNRIQTSIEEYQTLKEFRLSKQMKEVKSKHSCLVCGKVTSNLCYCSVECSRKAKEKIEWPTDDVLAILVWEKSCSQLAKELGVSDVAIAKRCKRRGITMPGRGYWAKV